MRVAPASSVCVSVSAKIAIATIMTSITGINILEHCSIPFSTPLKTIQAVSSMKIVAYSVDWLGDVMKSVKKLSCAAAPPWPVMYATM